MWVRPWTATKQCNVGDVADPDIYSAPLRKWHNPDTGDRLSVHYVNDDGAVHYRVCHNRRRIEIHPTVMDARRRAVELMRTFPDWVGK